jgi:hypothetical protein
VKFYVRSLSAQMKKSILSFKTFVPWVLVAAVLVLVFTLPSKHEMKLPPSVAALKGQSLVDSDYGAVNEFLEKSGINLTLREATGHHVKELIGAAYENIGGEKVVAVYFECCGKPAVVFILPKDGNAEKIILQENADWKSGIVANARKGEYRLALLSGHNSPELLELLDV